METPGLGLGRAALLNDQCQAFERLCIEYLGEVLAAWQFPAWVRAAFDGLLRGRAVRCCYGGVLGPLRKVLRGFDMGGPSSPFLWALAYDPIVVALADTLAVGAPTYVDDLAALPCGAPQMIACQIMLIALSHVAGLHISLHVCEVACAATGRAPAAELLTHFPVSIEPIGE